MSKVIIVTDDPIVEIIAEMQLNNAGVLAMARWIKRYRPDCVPSQGFKTVFDLLPHDGVDDDRAVTDNELLCELAGRKCYDSFAEKAAKRTNAEYLASMWQGRVPHRSTGYHAKMSFFFAHVSRRVSHELIRNYVGADRDEEGSPSQESTRFTHHPGVFIAHPADVADEAELVAFTESCQRSYDDYLNALARKEHRHEARHGAKPKGLDRKRIYESGSGYLHHSCATSFVWTTNPMAICKFLVERVGVEADLEMQRFAVTWGRVCLRRWPNLFKSTLPADVLERIA